MEGFKPDLEPRDYFNWQFTGFDESGHPRYRFVGHSFSVESSEEEMVRKLIESAFAEPVDFEDPEIQASK